MFYVISYDVVDDARRNRVSETLLDFGRRVQYSVFECQLEEELAAKMVERLRKVLDVSEDRLRVYALCATCKGRIQWIGSQGPREDPKAIIL
jgi:CRISPR-associated protein Cas2